MTKKIVIFIFVICQLPGFCRDPSWLQNHMKNIAESPSLSVEDQIKLLGGLARIGASAMDSEQRAVYTKARDTLLAIPGHAEYYANRINKLRDEVDRRIQAGDEYPPKSHLLDEQMYGFQTLSQLPSPETVRVLGEFLSDERGRMIIPPESKGHELALYDLWGQDPNSTLAAQTLSKLPLKTKPHAVIDEWDKESLTPWIQWYAQIKAGRRTFSFEGDPQEYDLNGPVSGPRNPDTPRESRRPPDSKSANATATHESSSSAPWVAGAIALLLGAGGWFYFRKTKE